MLIPIRSVSDDIDNNGLLATFFLLAIIPDNTFILSLSFASFSFTGSLVQLSAIK